MCSAEDLRPGRLGEEWEGGLLLNELGFEGWGRAGEGAETAGARGAGGAATAVVMTAKTGVQDVYYCRTNSMMVVGGRKRCRERMETG